MHAVRAVRSCSRKLGERGGGGREQQAFCLVAKQVVEFPQVLASTEQLYVCCEGS